jgi:hypothetical protein
MNPVRNKEKTKTKSPKKAMRELPDKKSMIP